MAYARLVVKIGHQSNVIFRCCQDFGGGMYHLKPLAVDGVKSYVPYTMLPSNMVNGLFRVLLSSNMSDPTLWLT